LHKVIVAVPPCGDSLLAREIVSDEATVSVDVDELDVDELGELSGSGSLNIETA